MRYVVIVSDDTGNIHCFGEFNDKKYASQWARDNVPYPGWMVRRVKDLDEMGYT